MLKRACAVVVLTLGECLMQAAPRFALGEEQPLGADGVWEQVFNEEFDGPALDPARWTTCYWWNKNGCTNLGNNELEWYLPENVRVLGGELRLTARQERTVGHEGRVFDYTSGMVTTGVDYAELPRPPRAAFRHGYFEVRAKVPAGQGLWPAIWLLPASRESKPEIDIVEVLGHTPTIMRMHFHYRNSEGQKQSIGENAIASDLSRRWHVFGLDWQQHTLIWYLNGVEKWRITDGRIPNEEMYLLINLAVGGDWPGPPDRSTVFPSEFLVDYVRVWRRAKS
jgi:beta-glucanase (GH16 family)